MYSSITVYRLVLILTFSQITLLSPKSQSIEIKSIKYLPWQFLAIKLGGISSYYFSHLWEVVDINGEVFLATLSYEAKYYGIEANNKDNYFNAFVKSQEKTRLFDISAIETQEVVCYFPKSTIPRYSSSLLLPTFDLALYTCKLIIFKLHQPWAPKATTAT